MKLIFAGTPLFAVLPLQKILEAGWDVAAVLTQPDKKQGRKGILTPSPVKTFASAHALMVLQPEKLRENVPLLQSAGADMMITCAYGQILTREILELFPRGVWNIHASLLPAYRGAAPVPRVLIDGCRETGITVMKTEEGLDTGDMLLQEKLAVGETDTCGTLSEKLSRLGAELILKALPLIEGGNYPLTPQGEGFVCKKVRRTPVNFARPAAEVSRLIRGLSPDPLAYGTADGLILNFYFAEEIPCSEAAACGEVLSVNPKEGLIVKCADGAVRITELQPSGGRRMSARDFLNGKKLRKGARFDQPVL